MRRAAVFALILTSLTGVASMVRADAVGCAMTCADNSPGSSCMSSCNAWSGGNSGGTGPSSATKYGAIALSPTTMDYGFSYRFPSRRQAEEAALTYCYANARKPRDCKVLSWFADTCGSLAIKPDSGKNDGAWGADWGSNRQTAQRKALQRCQKVAASGCETKVTVCAAQ